MRRVKRMMQATIIICSIILIVGFVMLAYSWLRLNGHYDRIFTSMTVAFINGDDVEHLRSEMAYANATANMKKADMLGFFWKGVAGILALVFSYIPVHFFAKEEQKEREKPKTKAEPTYMDEEEGEVLFDDRTGVN